MKKDPFHGVQRKHGRRELVVPGGWTHSGRRWSLRVVQLRLAEGDVILGRKKIQEGKNPSKELPKGKQLASCV